MRRFAPRRAQLSARRVPLGGRPSASSSVAMAPRRAGGAGARTGGLADALAGTVGRVGAAGLGGGARTVQGAGLRCCARQTARTPARRFCDGPRGDRTTPPNEGASEKAAGGGRVMRALRIVGARRTVPLLHQCGELGVSCVALAPASHGTQASAPFDHRGACGTLAGEATDPDQHVYCGARLPGSSNATCTAAVRSHATRLLLFFAGARPSALCVLVPCATCSAGPWVGLESGR